MTSSPKVKTCLWYDNNAEEAVNFYTSLLPNSKVISIWHPNPSEPLMEIDFTLCGTPYQALNGGPMFPHTEAASISVMTEDQDETDRLWDALTANGGQEGKCAWLKDRFGVSWQIVPKALMRYLGDPDREAADRAMQAMLEMSKIEIAKIEAAFKGKN